MNMTKKVVGTTLLVCMVLISVGSVAAMTGNQNGELYAAGDMHQEQTKEELKDGSCHECNSVVTQQQNKLQEQTKEQLQDGSCCDCDPVGDKQQLMLKEQTKEQLKNGSCGEGVDPVANQQQDMLQEQTKEQLQDGSCCEMP
jgi:hypothetical protein